MKFTEEQLNQYSQPLSVTEENQCKHAIRMVADALKELGFTDDGKEISKLYSDTLAYSLELRTKYSGRKIKLFIQGSYANNTNVRTKSDVDIAVIQEEQFQTEYRTFGYPAQSNSTYGFCKAAPSTKSFKDEVQECLESKFGTDVERKNKSIKIHGNSYRKDADAVPCIRYRDYRNEYYGNPSDFIGGVVIYADSGERIINYPEQHIENGRQKNDSTHHHYKKMVRIIKKMRYLMEESENSTFVEAAQSVSSFMLESLLWNVEDSWFLEYCGSYRKVFAFNQLISKLKSNKNQFNSYKEANGIKPLCSTSEDCDKLGFFLDQLSEFYEYI